MLLSFCSFHLSLQKIPWDCWSFPSGRTQYYGVSCWLIPFFASCFSYWRLVAPVCHFYFVSEVYQSFTSVHHHLAAARDCHPSVAGQRKRSSPCLEKLSGHSWFPSPGENYYGALIWAYWTSQSLDCFWDTKPISNLLKEFASACFYA